MEIDVKLGLTISESLVLQPLRRRPVYFDTRVLALLSASVRSCTDVDVVHLGTDDVVGVKPSHWHARNKVRCSESMWLGGDLRVRYSANQPPHYNVARSEQS